jgi:lipopolysaccharide transport system permease protein
VVGYGVRAWMYATPVVYSIDIIPEQWRALYRLNPMVSVIEGFRWALLGAGGPPDWRLLGLSFLLVTAVFVGGLYLFRSQERSIVDVA